MLNVRIVIPPSVSGELLDKYAEEVLRAAVMELASKTKPFESDLFEVAEGCWVKCSTSLLGTPPNFVFTVTLEPFDKS